VDLEDEALAAPAPRTDDPRVDFVSRRGAARRGAPGRGGYGPNHEPPLRESRRRSPSSTAKTSHAPPSTLAIVAMRPPPIAEPRADRVVALDEPLDRAVEPNR
jgi:hypothetical protein